MKDEMDENLLIMGAFALCPRSGNTVLANDCLECENIKENNGIYTCIYDEETDQNKMRIVDIINVLLELVENGKIRIDKEELAGLFGIGDD